MSLSEWLPWSINILIHGIIYFEYQLTCHCICLLLGMLLGQVIEAEIHKRGKYLIKQCSLQTHITLFTLCSKCWPIKIQEATTLWNGSVIWSSVYTKSYRKVANRGYIIQSKCLVIVFCVCLPYTTIPYSFNSLQWRRPVNQWFTHASRNSTLTSWINTPTQRCYTRGNQVRWLRLRVTSLQWVKWIEYINWGLQSIWNSPVYWVIQLNSVHSVVSIDVSHTHDPSFNACNNSLDIGTDIVSPDEQQHFWWTTPLGYVEFKTGVTLMLNDVADMKKKNGWYLSFQWLKLHIVWLLQCQSRIMKK